MPIYFYKGQNAAGGDVRGDIEARDEQDAREKLKKIHVYPDALKLVASNPPTAKMKSRAQARRPDEYEYKTVEMHQVWNDPGAAIENMLNQEAEKGWEYFNSIDMVRENSGCLGFGAYQVTRTILIFRRLI